MVLSDSDEMSAIAGLAMESSAKGWSLSTTTARFIGTLSLEATPARTSRTVSACRSDDAAHGPARANTPTQAALRKLSIFM